MLKLTTVADKIKQEHSHGLAGTSGVEILGLDMFQKMCDPLLANSANYHSLSKKAYMASKVMTKKNNNMDSSYISEISNSSPRVVRRPSVR